MSLLERLMHKRGASIRILIQECSTLGSIAFVDQHVRFVHEKLHASVLRTIDSAERPKLLVAIARVLEGMSPEYKYLQADMLLDAYESDPEILPRLEVTGRGEWLLHGSTMPLP